MSVLRHLVPTRVGPRQLVSRALRRGEPLLRALAWSYRRSLVRRTRFIVVVGSFGKTTTARAVSMAFDGSVHHHLQNNARAWRSLAVLRTRPGARHTVVEVGINGPGQMAKPAAMLAPDVVVVTAIGSEHNTSLGTLENTRAEKARMVEALGEDGVAILNGDDPHVLWMRERTPARVVTFGRSADCDVRVVETVPRWPDGSLLRVRCGDEETEVCTRLLGERPQNAVVAALAAAWVERLSLPDAARRLERLVPMRSRLEAVPLADGTVVVRDEVKSSWETIHVALDVLEQIPGRRKICVFGGISEPPGSQGPLYREIGERIAQIAAGCVLVVDSRAFQRCRSGATRAGMSPESIVHVDQDVQGAIRALKKMIEPGDVVLVKGRGSQRLHRISLALMGRPVGCAVRDCKLALVDCDFCSRLEGGWGERLTVP